MDILIVEDDRTTLAILGRLMQQEHSVTLCDTGEAGWAAWREHAFAMVFTDWILPGMSGLELCRRIRAHPYGETTHICVFTGNDQPGDLKKVLEAGADDYMTKPLDMKLLAIRTTIAINQARQLLKRREAEASVNALRDQLAEKAHFHDLVGKSRAMSAVFQLVHEIATVDLNVLITGETGTGKELVARAVHFESRRKKKPFVAINCGALTESLIESKLFGHVKGAFTGASGDRAGVFEEADGGTLLLDEIGDMPVNLQTSLLRVLETREITRVGDVRTRKVDVRVVAATHQNLLARVQQGEFRMDLYYRIMGVEVRLPPLRERLEDIPVLVEHFLLRIRTNSGKVVKGIDQAALEVLFKYSWPGNVRELYHMIEVAALLCKDGLIRSENLVGFKAPLQSEPEPAVTSELMEPLDVSNADIKAALLKHRGNKAKAARALGISRSTMYRRLETLDED